MDSLVRIKYPERDGINDLGNPQKRPMVNGRHKEISARVKHMDPVITESEESDCSI